MSSDLDYSVIIPTYNRPAGLGRCLAALAELDYPRDSFEVVVVDDGSPQPPESIVAEWRSRLPVRLVTQSNAGPAKARNRGAAEARGRWLAFLDDDCEVTPGWLQGFASVGADQEEVLGGATYNGLVDCPYATASQVLVGYVCRWIPVKLPTLAFFPTNNLAVSAEEFHRIGGYCEEFPLAAAEDREFCYRWLRASGRLASAPSAIVKHCHALSFRSFWWQHFNYGRGADTFRQKLAADDTASWRNPPGFYSGLVRAVVRSGWEWWAKSRTVMLLALSQIIYSLGYMFERTRNFGRPSSISPAATPPSLIAKGL